MSDVKSTETYNLSRSGASSFSVIKSISLNTFREAVRSRILYLILIFALLLMASSGVIRDLTISAQDRVVRDLGLAAINFFGLAVAILVGIGLVYNELDKKSIYTIISKPVARWQFLLGKYFGLLLTIYVNILIMGLFFLAVINYQDQTSDEKITSYVQKTGLVELSGGAKAKFLLHAAGISAGKAVANLVGRATIPQTEHINGVIFATALELAIITAFAILYSSFSTPTLSAIFTVMTFIAGRLNQDIWAYAMKISSADLRATVTGNVKYYLAMGACHIVPNLGLLRESSQQLNQPHYAGVQWFEGFPGLFGVLPYSLSYTAMILCLSIIIFRSRNFK